MKQLLSLGLLLLGVSGCSSPADDIVKDQLKAMHDLIHYLDSIKDEQTAGAAVARITELDEHLQELERQIDGLALTPEQRERAYAKHARETALLAERLKRSWTQAGRNAGSVSFPMPRMPKEMNVDLTAP